MLRLDPHSIVFTVLLGHALSVFVYLFYIYLYRIHENNLRLYVTGKIFQTFTWLIFFVWPDRLTGNVMAITNTFLFIGTSIECYCMMWINEEKTKKLKKEIFIITIIAVFSFALFRNNVTIRVIVTSAFISTVYFYLFYYLALKKGNSKMQTVVGWVTLLFVLINITRGSIVLISGMKIPVYTDIPIQILLGLMWLVIAYTFPLLFLFIIIEKDHAKLNELNTAKDRFFSIIGHDLKGPIGQMIQFSQLLQDGYKDLSEEEIQKFTIATNKSSIRGFKLLENLLDWAQSQTGRISFHPEPFLISDLIRENIELLNSQAEMKNIKIISSGLQEVTLTADKNMMGTVIRNLLSNAIKYSYPNSKIEVNNRTDGENLFVSIKDNGEGISNEDCSNLFKLDSGHSTKGTNKKTGTGIGLILCKEFIEKHKGEIWVESELGKGSTFFFTIPLIYGK